jgi:hypothetical protein
MNTQMNTQILNAYGYTDEYSLKTNEYTDEYTDILEIDKFYTDVHSKI